MSAKVHYLGVSLEGKSMWSGRNGVVYYDEREAEASFNRPGPVFSDPNTLNGATSIPEDMQHHLLVTLFEAVGGAIMMDEYDFMKDIGQYELRSSFEVGPGGRRYKFELIDRDGK